jgi:hypothetical protein
MAYIFSRTQYLSDAGISGYSYIARSYDPAYSVFYGIYFAPNQTSAQVLRTLSSIQSNIFLSWPLQISITTTPVDYSNYLSWWTTHISLGGHGKNVLLGSRLLNAAALSKSLTVLEQALRDSSPLNNTSILHLVAGKGVQNAQPSGGSNAVNPAWRGAYIHYGKGSPSFRDALY